MARHTMNSMAFFSPDAIAHAIMPIEEKHTTTLFVTNLHCASCVTHAKDTLRPIHGIFNVDVNLLGHTICVQHDIGLASTITDVLLDAAFEIQHVTTSDASGRVIASQDMAERLSQLEHGKSLPLFMNKTRRKHIANCQACRSSQPSKTFFTSFLAGGFRKRKRSTPREALPDLEKGSRIENVSTGHCSDEKVELHNADDDRAEALQHIATISITGMTCASCTTSITNELSSLDFVSDVQVNLLSNNATITYHGSKEDASNLVDAIEDVGFEATIDTVEPLPSAKDKVDTCTGIFSIEGMTCGSCVAAVEEGLRGVQGLLSVNVDLVGNCVTAKMKDKAIAAKVTEAIDDLGFEGALVEFKTEDSFGSDEQKTRTVDWQIDGMYCPKCPENISLKLKESFGDEIEMLASPTLKQPRLTIKYTPLPPTMTVRRIKYAIESADPAIIASVYHQPTMEERSQNVQRRESNRILRHLLFTLVAAIPSFVIGIVYMSLVPSNDSIRMWFEQPIWAGQAMRIDWAMFFITTPVMFYGATIFHTRALKEIWALWRPKSKVPVLRRLYRFGSMNLLLSAGTSVAYFSSLAILIMEATASPTAHSSTQGKMQNRHSITYFDTVTFLTLFILCGKFLQAYSKSKTGDAVAMLGKLRPTEALLIDEHIEPYEQEMKAKTRSIPIDLLEIGDIVSIPHGGSPPTDGIIDQDGTFLFDESSLTGESKPVKKSRGDTILTGSVNISDPVKIVVKELGGKSMLDQIINVVRSGQAKRAPIERFADIVTSYFTPIITLIAILTWVVWLSLGQSGILPRSWLDVEQGGWAFWSVEFAIAVFVVACPCGLGLAAPTALFVGGGLAAKNGILVQGGGEAFQEASKLDTIVFDKTGTLTEGRMRVTGMKMLRQDDEQVGGELVMRLASSLEDQCTHPIAKAIRTFCEAKLTTNSDGSDIGPKPSSFIESIDAMELKEVPGQGMTGVFEVKFRDGSSVVYEAAIGNERQLASLIHVNTKSTEKATTELTTTPEYSILTSQLYTFQSTGCSTAILSVRRSSRDDSTNNAFTPVAVFGITDPIRIEAPAVLSALRKQGTDIHMCTGDNPATARAIASQLSIPVANIRAGVLPQDKATYIHELQSGTSKRNIVAFCGDGTNDTPALQAADVSIALSSGSDIALTSASFILLNSDLQSIEDLLQLSKRVFRRVKINFAWAGVYNVALIPVAAGVFFPIAQWRLSPVWAAAAMAGSSVSVVLSSMALKLPELSLRRRRSRNDERYLVT